MHQIILLQTIVSVFLLESTSYICGLSFRLVDHLIFISFNLILKKIWYESWSQLGCLKERVGDRGTIALGIEDNAMMVDVLITHRRRRHRECVLNDIEDEIEKLKNGSVQDDDRPLWRSAEGKYMNNFSSKKTWLQLRISRPVCAWNRGVWFPQATPKYSFMLWIAMRNRMQTGDKMQAWNTSINTECVLCHEVQETGQHLFFSCPYSFIVWESLVKGLLRERFTAVWNDIVALISDSSYPPTEMFLIRYSLQVAVHGIWRERNARRHGEKPKDARVLSRLMDKTIRLHLLAVKAQNQAYLEKGLRTWFGTRIVSDPL